MRNLAMLRAASQFATVDVLTFHAADSSPKAEPDQSDIAGRYARIQPPSRPLSLRALDTVRSRLPDMAWRLWSPEFAGTLRRWAAEQPYDAIQVEGIELGRYALPTFGQARVVFDDHNVEFLLQQRAYEADRTDPRRWHGAGYSAIQARKLRRFEHEICTRADRVVTVSAEDARRLSELGPREPLVIPNTLDISRYVFTPRPDQAPPVALFPGTMSFRPNADAARWLIQRVLPELASLAPEIRLFIAGRHPPSDLIRYGQANPAIAVTGEVPDMAPYWARSTVCVLPLQVGGGTRFKALEAMALGLPVVSTSLGMEGIEALPGRDFLLANTPAAFAHAVAHVFHDPALRRSLADHARQIVERHYTQEIVDQRLRDLYAGLWCHD